MQKVLVIGLRRTHIDYLKEKFKDIYDISALDDQSCHVKKISNSEAYQTIINCTKFTNHSTERLYNKHPGFVRISGGRSSVKNFLESNDQQLHHYC